MSVRIVRAAKAGDPAVYLLTAALQDEKLSFRARGVLASVLSRPRDWRTSAEQLAREGREGRDAIRAALTELDEAGYLQRALQRSEDGRLWGMSWIISDRPERRKRRRPTSGNQPSANQPTEDPPTADPPSLDPPSPDPLAEDPPSLNPQAEDPQAAGPPSLTPPSPGQPHRQSRETRRETPPPTPAPEQPDEVTVSHLEGVVVGELRRRGTPTPGTRPLRAECRRLALLGWSPDSIRSVIASHDWTGARAGAVITWLRDLDYPAPAAAPGRRGRPPHCGSCDPASRLLLDAQDRPRPGKPCPKCHPTTYLEVRNGSGDEEDPATAARAATG